MRAMATTLLGDTTVLTVGELPAVGSPAPAFTPDRRRPARRRHAVHRHAHRAQHLSQRRHRRLRCERAQVQRARGRPRERDRRLRLGRLPFALGRFCGAEGIEDVVTASSFRSSFGYDYGVRMENGGFAGLLARAVVVIDADGTVIHTELVPAIGQEPDYDAAVAALG